MFSSFNKSGFNRYLDKIEGQYNFIKKYSKPLNNICGVVLEDITFLPYDVLKVEIPELFNNQQFEMAIFVILSNFKKSITFKQVKRESNSNKLLFVFWIREQYDKINKLEENYLYNPPDAKLLQAGIKELDVLGDVNTIDALANGDILKWKEIRQLSYNDVFNKLLKNTIEARINKRLVDINKMK